MEVTVTNLVRRYEAGRKHDGSDCDLSGLKIRGNLMRRTLLDVCLACEMEITECTSTEFRECDAFIIR